MRCCDVCDVVDVPFLTLLMCDVVVFGRCCDDCVSSFWQACLRGAKVLKRAKGVKRGPGAIVS